MSHRKFEHPRCGHLGYLPKRRTKHHKGKCRTFPNDDKTKPVHLTAFMGYKAGMTHVVRGMEKREGRKTIKKDVVEAVTVVECPPMKVIGMVGYIETPRGLRALSTVWAQKLPDGVMRRFYKNYYCAKKKAFSKYAKRYSEDAKSKNHPQRDVNRIKKYCTVVRVLCCTQIEKLKFRQRKAHLMEIQVNGGSVADKVKWAQDKFEQEIPIGSVFEKDEMVDTIAITRGKGTTGVIKRFGVTRLPRKTHRGLRRVACIGAWHPAAVKWTVARTGNQGYFHRTHLNQKVYRVGEAASAGCKNNGTTKNDLTDKNITPLGGFPHYGVVNEQFLMVKGGCVGCKKRVLVLRKSLLTQQSRRALEAVDLRFIDTASKMGHGRFQTA